MTDYRRNFVAGGSFFFTVNLAERRLRLLTEHIDELRTALRQTRRHHPFTIDAFVVLPDHLHSVWTLPEGDADFATRWRLIKSAFRAASKPANGFQTVAPPKANAASGSGAIGAYHPRRERFCPSCGLYPYQPGQAWACLAGQGLAVFVVPPNGTAWNLPRGLAGDVSNDGGNFGERP